MDADTRHQLKQNELAEALARLRDLRDPRFLYSLAAVAVVAVAAIAWFGWRYTRERGLEQTSLKLADAREALFSQDGARMARAQEDLRGMMAQTSDPDLRASAGLLLARSRYDQAMNDPGQRPTGFEEAARLLQDIRGDPEVSPVLAAAATFLLANADESLGRIDEAKKLWETLAHEPIYDGTPYKELATDRLANVDELTRRVPMQPGQPPAPTTAAAEASGPSGFRFEPESIMLTPETEPPFAPGPPRPSPTGAPPPAAEGTAGPVEAGPPAETPAPVEPVPPTEAPTSPASPPTTQPTS